MDLKGLIGEIKSNLKLEEVMAYVGVEFTSKTGDAWKAKCWGHEERVASLTVSPRKGLYHCFSTGCGCSGDVLSFYAQWHSLEVHEAAIQLANEFGIDTGQFLEQSEEEKKIGHYKKIMARVALACHAEMLKSKEAMAYVKKRGVSIETVKEFQIGFSPSPAFVLKAAGAGSGDGQTLGLGSKLQYGQTILFPVYRRGAPAFFYSKTLSKPNGEGPKYAGPSGSHPLRDAGSMFGLQVARKEARTQGVVLVEGFFDVLALHSHGFTNAVGMLGSSPRVEQMQELASLHIPTATVLFDADNAGEKGVLKAIEARRGDVQIRVAFCPQGDPDEYVISAGVDALRGVLTDSIGASDYLLGLMSDRLMGGDLSERSQTIKMLAALSTKLPGHEAALMMKELSDTSGIPLEELREASIVEDDKRSVQDEATVLAACLRDETSFLEAQAKFRGHDIWLLSKHRTIWQAMASLRKRGVMEFTPELIKEAANGVHLNGTLDSLFDRQISNFEYHLGLACDASTRRALRRAGRYLAAVACDESKVVSAVLGDHLTRLSKEVSPDSSVEFTAAQQVESAMDYIHERMESGNKIPGLTMGDSWKTFTEATLGWQGGHMNLVSALPKRGKTTLAMNWARALSIDQQIPILWMNFEMKQRDLSLRFMSMLSGVSNTRLRMGAISQQEKQKVDEAAEKYYAAPLYVVDSAALSLPEVINMMRKYVYDKGVKCIVIDYIQLIRKSDPRLQYWEHHQSISTELKSAITTLDVPLIGISQLSKGALEGGGAANQGGAFKYLQDCDMAMELRPRTPDEMVDDPTANLHLNVEYSRHGQQELYFKLLLNPQTLSITEV